MTAPLYLFHAPEADGLTPEALQAEWAQLRQTLEPMQALSLLSDASLLTERLKAEREAVVILRAPIGKLAEYLEAFRASQPTTAFIALVTDEESRQIRRFDLPCDYLTLPLSPFDVLSRTAQATRFAQLAASLQDTSQLDAATGLHNVRYFHQRLSDCAALAKRHQSPLSCVIVGVDHYAYYLDTYTYDAVTELLQEIGGVIRQYIRQEDILAHVADDEFGILLPMTSPQSARLMADRLLQHLNTVPLKLGSDQEAISVHVGIAGTGVGDEILTADTYLRYARHALHHARNEDREQVEDFDDIEPAFH